MLSIEKINLINALLASKQTASVTEANQNFSKIARIADQEGSVVLLKNNRPKYVLIDLEQLNQKSFSPEEFLSAFKENGIWVLCDANEGVKAYLKNRYPEKYTDEIAKAQTVQKLIKTENDLIVVSINHPEWAGVFKIALGDVQITQDDEGILTLSYDPEKGKRELSIADFSKPVEKPVQLLNGKTIRAQTYEPDFQRFNQILVQTGYVTDAEIEQSSAPDARKYLPLVRTALI